METPSKTKPFYKRRKFWIIATIAAVILFGISRLASGPAAPKETSKIERGTVKEELVLSGEIRAQEEANLAFGGSGKLTWIGVKTGDRVVRGQALAKLDTVILNTSYQQALSALRAADATVARVHDDLKGKDTSETFTEKETRVTAEVAKDRAYENMVAARKALFEATLTAPFNGVVTEIVNESPGMNVVAGTTQITVVNPESIYFSVNADQTEVSHFKIGDNSQITLDAFDEKTLTGTITEVAFTPSTQESGTVYPIRLKLLADNMTYRLGLTGDASFVLSEKQNVLHVPNKFIKSDPTGRYVFVGDGTVKKYIEVGIEGDERVEIIGDIEEGTTIFN